MFHSFLLTLISFSLTPYAYGNRVGPLEATSDADQFSTYGNGFNCARIISKERRDKMKLQAMQRLALAKKHSIAQGTNMEAFERGVQISLQTVVVHPKRFQSPVQCFVSAKLIEKKKVYEAAMGAPLKQ